jgi:hypothetical protein
MRQSIRDRIREREAWPFGPSSYMQTVRRAAYYRWAAQRGHTLPGGDPISGRPRSIHDVNARQDSRVAYLAMARRQLELAAFQRASGDRPNLPTTSS